MKDQGNTGHARTARLCRGAARVLGGSGRFLLAITLSVFLSFTPLETGRNSAGLPSFQRSEAMANPAIALPAGAALASLAAEIGISEAALYAGIGAVALGATGLTFLWKHDPTEGTITWDPNSAPMPGWKPWGELTPGEQQSFGYSQDEYAKQAIGWWALQYGLLETADNGNGLEPAPEPDPDTDPDGHSRWQKARNVMVALALGAGGVALNEALAPFADGIGASIKELLFGNKSQGGSYDGLGLTYGDTYRIGNVATDPVTFVYNSGFSFTTNDVTTTWNHNQWIALMTPYSNYPITWYVPITPTDYRTLNFTYSTVSGYTSWTAQTGSNAKWYGYNGSQIQSMGAGSFGIYLPFYSTPANYRTYLNAQYGGVYNFGNGITYQDGYMNGNAEHLGVDYGQMPDTPSGLTQNILNQNDYNNWITNYTVDAPDGSKRVVTVPSAFGGDDFESTYGEWVKVENDTNVIPIPDDQPLNPENPNPPNPTPDDFDSDLEQTVGDLLLQPFTQLFPFCLITDLRDLTQKISSAVYDDGLGTQAVENWNGTEVFVIPLEDFGIDGLDNLFFELQPVRDFGNLVRPWTTALFIVALLVGSFRFFLNRGGE